MKGKKGILAALDADIILENKIAFALQQALTAGTDAAKYSDRKDIQNVRRRGLIIAALSAIFQYLNDKQSDATGYANIELTDGTNPYDELSAALRDLLHDTERLNAGMEAERVAKPVIRESITDNETIPINRKIKILWYVASELHSEEDKDLFKTQKALEEHAAILLGSTQGSLKTSRSQLKSKGNVMEKAFFYKHLNECRQLSKESGGKISPLKLIFPALQALSVD